MTQEIPIAIACQGGGSHCAFGAGVLQTLLAAMPEPGVVKVDGRRYRVTGLSGTSGGAINALLAWSGLVLPAGPAAGIHALEAFWEDNSAQSPWDLLENVALVSGVRLRGLLPQLEVAPNALSDHAQNRLRTLLHTHIPFPALAAAVGPASPQLLIGAAAVLSGEFQVFGKEPGFVPSAEHVLASTAVPELFRPVRIGRQYYWDGLLSQNPPVRDFLRGRTAAESPAEIWVIRINPLAREDVPQQLHDILDRRNEMAGNISLAQEVEFIRRVNDWLAEGRLPPEHYRHVDIREIALEEKGHAGDGLDYASKLDRRPEFIADLMARGRRAGGSFLEKLGK